jgi:mercuric ion binding protein
MKSLKLILMLFVLLASIATVNAGPEKKTITFKVYGNCGMCKRNIETALDIKGVKSATWNVTTKMVEVVFIPTQISEEEIHQAIAKSGYDTDKIKAKDEDYNALHGCCQYRK